MSEVDDSDPHDSDPHEFDPRDSDPRNSSSPGDGGCGDGALYLLGLLDERHTRMFVEHARSCALCSDDLAALAPAVEHLPSTVRQVPAPARAKRQVMAVVRGEAAEQAARSSSRASHQPNPSPSSSPSSSPRARGWTARGRFALRPALALAGATALAAGIAIGALSSPFGGGSTPAGGSEGRVVSADVTVGGASAALHQSGGHTWLTVANMPEPSSGHVYEVWVKRPGRAEPQPTDSLFAPTSAG
ncbi:MAG: hypothetical protein ABSH36_16280, partial [Solirubrobacteraceae bacterium]